MKAIKSARYLCRAAFALGLMMAAGMPAHGQGVPGYPDDVRFGFDPRELALLPRYCLHTQVFRDRIPGGSNPDEIARWTSAMGPSFHHMHHYCWGLMKTNRAVLLVRSQQYRTYYLKDAIGEFDYVIRNSSPDFKMLPEILTKRGENLIRLDRGPEAVPDLQRAIALKPDYWPSYAAMSDYYSKTGDVARAREWLEEGLSITPDVQALKRRMAELGKAENGRKTAPQRPANGSAPQLSGDKGAPQ